LLSLDPPLSVEKSLITRWHPSFRVDSVPDIPPLSTFPQKPKVDHVSSARDVLARARDVLSVNERMHRALVQNSKESAAESDHVDKGKQRNITETIKKVNKLKGVSQALLDKVIF
jgi:hypothetical protein